MLISHFISTRLSHRTFKLHKSKMDSGLSPLNFFLPLGSLILVNNTMSPPSCSGPKIWCHPHLLLYLVSDSKANPLANSVGFTSKVCPYLDTSHTLHCQQPVLSHQSILPGPPKCSLSSLVISYNTFFTWQPEWSFKNGKPGHAPPCWMPQWLPKPSSLVSSCPFLLLISYPLSPSYSVSGPSICWASSSSSYRS